ncbi:hypothetical protein PIB30_026790 [Stylosanthes scabra]|uniref:Uncharacterized protein n=1 Tax=Stylosanthes scabra TaxID=79078 RepID=A0ABU6Y943_9FABA|nr:hypothetical protein [Stylosanthes scabra]
MPMNFNLNDPPVLSLGLFGTEFNTAETAVVNEMVTNRETLQDQTLKRKRLGNIKFEATLVATPAQYQPPHCLTAFSTGFPLHPAHRGVLVGSDDGHTVYYEYCLLPTDVTASSS